MPSKKKKKKDRGKTKKAAKKAEEQGTLDTQMERLKIDQDSRTHAEEDALLEEAIKLAAAEKEEMDATAAERKEDRTELCYHGYVPGDGDIIRFAETCFSGLDVDCGASSFAVSLGAATDVVEEKYPDILYESSKLKLVVSVLLSDATQLVLQGDCGGKARSLAASASYFDSLAEALKGGENIKMDTAIIIELYKCDEHTLVKYLRKRIPCSCLDEKYNEVKSITRMGLCFNAQCTSNIVQRSKMLSCARCGEVNYCSRECQKAAWPEHKTNCG